MDLLRILLVESKVVNTKTLVYTLILTNFYCALQDVCHVRKRISVKRRTHMIRLRVPNLFVLEREKKSLPDALAPGVVQVQESKGGVAH